MKKHRLNRSGFTIIEVVLVLAIAGLIFLMVFVALPALQRNQRDTQRKNDLAIFVDSLQRYAANNRNQYPKNTTELRAMSSDYLKISGEGDSNNESGSNREGIFEPNSGISYRLWGTGSGSLTPTYLDYLKSLQDAGSGYHLIYFHIGFRCPDASDPNTAPADSSHAIAWMPLEQGTTYCVQVY